MLITKYIEALKEEKVDLSNVVVKLRHQFRPIRIESASFESTNLGLRVRGLNETYVLNEENVEFGNIGPISLTPNLFTLINPDEYNLIYFAEKVKNKNGMIEENPGSEWTEYFKYIFDTAKSYGVEKLNAKLVVCLQGFSIESATDFFNIDTYEQVLTNFSVFTNDELKDLPFDEQKASLTNEVIERHTRNCSDFHNLGIIANNKFRREQDIEFGRIMYNSIPSNFNGYDSNNNKNRYKRIRTGPYYAATGLLSLFHSNHLSKLKKHLLDKNLQLFSHYEPVGHECYPLPLLASPFSFSHYIESETPITAAKLADEFHHKNRWTKLSKYENVNGNKDVVFEAFGSLWKTSVYRYVCLQAYSNSNRKYTIGNPTHVPLYVQAIRGRKVKEVWIG